MIIGGNNSAIDAALELARVGAEVTVVYRGEKYSDNIKPWVLPTFKSLVEQGVIHMMFSSQVISIQPDSVTIRTPEGQLEMDNDFVLALTGFRPDRKFLEKTGVEMDAESDRPVYNPRRWRRMFAASMSPVSSLPGATRTRSSSRAADSTAISSPNISVQAGSHDHPSHAS